MAVEEAIQEEFENNNNNHSAFHHQKQAFLPNTPSTAETPSEQKLNQNNGPSSLVYEPSVHSNPRWRPQQLLQQPRGKNTWFDDKVREFLDSCELDTICQESNVYRVKSKVIFLVLSLPALLNNCHFLVAKLLYNYLCPSVCPYVRPSVRLSLRLSDLGGNVIFSAPN